MSKIDVQVQTDFVICDDEGHQLIPAGIFKVEEGTLVHQYIADGLLTVVTSAPQPVAAEEEAPKEEPKKAKQQRTPDSEESSN